MTAAAALTEALARVKDMRRRLTTEIGCPMMSGEGCQALDGIITALGGLQSSRSGIEESDRAAEALEGIVDQLCDLASDTYGYWIKAMRDGPYVPENDDWKYKGDDE